MAEGQRGPADTTPHLHALAAPRSVAATLDFDAFFAEQAPPILALLRALTGDAGRAEDLAQEAFVAAYRNWDRISGYDKPGAWVRKTAVNGARSAFRRRAHERNALARFAARPVAASVDVADAAGSDEAFWLLVRRLPRQQAAAVAMHYLDDAPVADIAAALGCAPATARVHLHRGRATLAAALGEPFDEPTPADDGVARKEQS
jgi:RNA polymerase sigma-70 factor (ECF subfamily)